MANHLRKVVPVPAVQLALADVITIYKRLAHQVEEQRDFEISHAVKQPAQTDAQFDELIAKAKADAFKVTTSLVGRDGQTFFGADATVFESASRPDPIGSIFMTNATAYTATIGRRPICVFELTLDFSKPPLVDASMPVSAPTPNMSVLSVEGDREAWVAAIADAVNSIVSVRKTRRGWLHRGSIYDAGVLLVGLPFALYVCWKASSWIQGNLGSITLFLASAAYVYIFFLVLNLYRVLFGYTKWAFPKIELIDNRDRASAHRAVWAGIVLALVGNILWELRSLF